MGENYSLKGSLWHTNNDWASSSTDLEPSNGGSKAHEGGLFSWRRRPVREAAPWQEGGVGEGQATGGWGGVCGISTKTKGKPFSLRNWKRTRKQKGRMDMAREEARQDSRNQEGSSGPEGRLRVWAVWGRAQETSAHRGKDRNLLLIDNSSLALVQPLSVAGPWSERKRRNGVWVWVCSEETTS